MRIIRSSLLLAAVLCFSTVHAQDRELSARGVLLDGIAALVNDGVVLKSELQIEYGRIVQRLQAQGAKIPPERTLQRQVLERLVVRQIQLQRADRLGIQISDETLNNALAAIARNNGVLLADLPRQLAAEGIDYTAYRQELREQIAIEQLRQRDVLSRIMITPREIDEYLARQAGKSALNMEYDLSQILVAVPSAASPDDIAAAGKKARELYDRLQAGENFAEVAMTQSDGQQALEGGALGWLKGEELPTIFADIVPGLQKGQVAEPIRSASGFHLVRLNDRRGGEPIIERQMHVRHILIAPNEVLDSDAARDKLLGIRERIVAGDDFSAVARAVSDDPGSKNQGGDLGWVGPGVLTPEFQAAADALQENTLSEPVRSPFGWHLIEVLGRRTQDTTEEVQRQQAAMAIRNSRLNEEMEIWMRRLRDQAFVEYRI